MAGSLVAVLASFGACHDTDTDTDTDSNSDAAPKGAADSSVADRPPGSRDAAAADGAPADAAPADGARADGSVPATWVDEQVAFVLSKQLGDGAIVGANSFVKPYFSNVGAIGLIAANTSAARAGALAWMKWYLAHLNPASADVPANSTFDYEYDASSGSLTPTGDFDSVDSYASTTLNLAYAAYTSGDATLMGYVSSNIVTYEAIANLLTQVEPAGVRIPAGSPGAELTVTKPSYRALYTMDNAEVYSGLAEFARLEDLLQRPGQAAIYRAAADATKAAIEADLWNAARGNWDVAFGVPSGTSGFYADGTAQLWPALYGVVAPTDAKAVAAWSQFTASFPTWYVNVPDNYAWTSVARAAQVMGVGADATTYLTNLHGRFSPGWTLPTSCGLAPCGEWYINEAGWFIVAAIH